MRGEKVSREKLVGSNRETEAADRVPERLHGRPFVQQELTTSLCLWWIKDGPKMFRLSFQEDVESVSSLVEPGLACSLLCPTEHHRMTLWPFQAQALRRPGCFSFCALGSHESPCHEVWLLCWRNHLKRKRERGGGKRERQMPGQAPAIPPILAEAHACEGSYSRCSSLWPRARPAKESPWRAPLRLQSREQIRKCYNLEPFTYLGELLSKQ